MPAVMLVAGPGSSEPAIGPEAAERLAHLGITRVSLLSDSSGIGVMLEGWAFTRPISTWPSERCSQTAEPAFGSSARSSMSRCRSRPERGAPDMERQKSSDQPRGRQRLVASIAALGLLAMFAGSAMAAANASELPPNWHVHDGQGAVLGPQHKGIGFFPAILGLATAVYLQDPAKCPNATDKAFLPSADTSEGPNLRAGQCQTSTQIIHMRTVPAGTAGPDGWSSITVASEPGWVTYYLVTPR